MIRFFRRVYLPICAMEFIYNNFPLFNCWEIVEFKLARSPRGFNISLQIFNQYVCFKMWTYGYSWYLRFREQQREREKNGIEMGEDKRHKAQSAQSE